MDLKETDILGDSIGEHWYYCSKAAATRRLLGEAPITRILDVGAGSGFFASSVDPNLGAGGVVRRYQLPRRF
jgi:methylase of polypeptide subunit release factors